MQLVFKGSALKNQLHLSHQERFRFTEVYQSSINRAIFRTLSRTGSKPKLSNHYITCPDTANCNIVEDCQRCEADACPTSIGINT